MIFKVCDIILIENIVGGIYMIKKVLIILGTILAISVLIILLSNKTFFKTTYIGINNQEIFIPRYSFFKREAGMTVASFYSLKPERVLRSEIDDYMQDFEYFEDESTYGYKKGNLFIQSYIVANEGLYRKIYITYWEISNVGRDDLW